MNSNNYSFIMELPDQKVWDLSQLLYNSFKKDEEQSKLDVQKLAEFKKKNIKPLYPHKSSGQDQIQRYSCCQACCTVDPGSFCCCKSSPPDASFRKLGLGMCLYFKFMKHFTVLLLCISVLSVAACLICYLVSLQNQFSITDNTTFFFSSTMGTFSSERLKCQYSTINSSNQASFSLSCPHGLLSLYGAVFSYESQNSIYNCQSEIRKYQNNDATYSTQSYITSSTASACSTSQSSCSISLNFQTSRPNFTTVAYGYQCTNQVYQLSKFNINSQYLLYAVVSIDLFCCLIFTIFYCSETRAQDRQIAFFKAQQLSLNDFSIKIKGINLSNYDQELNLIVRYLQSKLGQGIAQQLVQVKIPDRNDYVQYQQNKNYLYNKLYEIIDDYFFDQQINPKDFKSPEDFASRNFEEGKYQVYKKKLLQAVAKFYQLRYSPELQNDNKSVSIFVVFNSIKTKSKIFQLQEEDCCSTYMNVQGKKYTISQPPAPDMVQWKNKGKWTFLRMFISWVLTLAICFGSYMLFGYLQYQQNSLLSAYNLSINCNVLYPSANFSVFDSTLNSQSSNYLSCFCKNNLVNFDNADSYRCSDYRTQYATYVAIPVVISLLMVIYNVLVSSIFKLLTIFQSHRLISSELLSFTVKRSFILILNMGVVIILLNMKFSSSVNMTQVSFLFQGKYSSIAADWYISIGSIIIMTMIFNISFPIIELILTNLLKCLKHCWDRKCGCRKTSCKTKNQYIKLFSNDIYPIEERYAFLVSIILLTMAFSCVIPILNIICAFLILLLYFADKVLVFKVFQTPINYNSELHSLICKVIYLGLVVHMALSAYFLSQPTMVAPNSYLSNPLNSGSSRMNTIISTNYIIPYVVLFALYIVWAFFSNTIIAIFQKFICSCAKEQTEITKYKLQQSFYESLNSYQIGSLILMVEGQIDKLTTKKKSCTGPSATNPDLNTSLNILNTDILKPAANIFKVSEHEAILRRSLAKLKAEQSLRRPSKQGESFLAGMAGYEIMVNSDAFEQNRKNMLLTADLSRILKDSPYFQNDQL